LEKEEGWGKQPGAKHNPCKKRMETGKSKPCQWEGSFILQSGANSPMGLEKKEGGGKSVPCEFEGSQEKKNNGTQQCV